MSARPPASSPAYVRKGIEIPGTELYALSDLPGLWRKTSVATNQSVEASVPISNGKRRTVWLDRLPGTEAAVSKALQLATVTDEELFVCDGCGIPTRSAVLTEGEALCPKCSRHETA